VGDTTPDPRSPGSQMPFQRLTVNPPPTIYLRPLRPGSGEGLSPLPAATFPSSGRGSHHKTRLSVPPGAPGLPPKP